MAITILPQRQDIGSALGSALGTGLSSGITSALDQRKNLQGLTALGIPVEQASQIAQLNPALQQLAVKNLLEAPQRQSYASAIQQLLGGEATSQEGGGFSALTQLKPEQATKLAELQLAKERQAASKEQQEKKLSATEINRIQKETLPSYNKAVEEGKESKDALKTLDKMEALIERGKLPPAALYKSLKSLQEIPAHYAAGGGATVGGTTGFGLGGPVGAAIGAGVGGLTGLALQPIISLMEAGVRGAYPDTEQYDKLSKSFIRGGKALFGNRMTDLDLKTLLDMIPTLANTDAGKKSIIEDMREFYHAGLARAKAAKEIAKENKGVRPANFDELLTEKSDKEIDKAADNLLSKIRFYRENQEEESTPFFQRHSGGLIQF